MTYLAEEIDLSGSAPDKSCYALLVKATKGVGCLNLFVPAATCSITVLQRHIGRMCFRVIPHLQVGQRAALRQVARGFFNLGVTIMFTAGAFPAYCRLACRVKVFLLCSGLSVLRSSRPFRITIRPSGRPGRAAA